MVFEQTGTTSFPVDGATRDFIFTVTAEEEKLAILLEDCVTKEQWHTKALDLTDFVTLETAIPQAKVVNYAARVVQSLAPECDADKPTRSLSRPSGDGSRVLCVGFTLQAAAFTTVLEYSFALSAVPLEATDLLKARMRDLELIVHTIKTENEALHKQLVGSKEPSENEELEREMATMKAENKQLRVELTQLNKAVKASAVKPFAEFRAESNTGSQQAIVWTPVGDVDKEHFVTSEGTPTQIVVVQGGVYTVFVSILHASSNIGHQVEVLLDSTSLRTFNDFNTDAHRRQSTMMIKTKIAAQSYLQVFYRGNNTAYQGSTITLMQDSALVTEEEESETPSTDGTDTSAAPVDASSIDV